MPELILLCEGAAPDRDAGASPDAFDLAAKEIRGAVASARLRALFGAGSPVWDRAHEELAARESPADAWLRARLAVPDEDAVQAYAAHATAERDPEGDPEGERESDHGRAPESDHGRAPESDPGRDPESGPRSPRWSLRPAHVQVGYDQVRLADPGDLALDARDASELAATIAPLFAEAGYALGLASPDRWFFTAERSPGVQAFPWTIACGRSIDAYLPEGPGARQWRRLLNEVQMHWHEHPANARREAAGRAPVNMLWLDGRASGALARSLGAVATGDAAIAGLARAAGARLVAPESAAGSAAPGDVLLDVPLWREARRGAQVQAWAQAWHDFDRWLERHRAPLARQAGFERVRAVFTGDRRRVELVSDAGAWKRWWRRFDPLAAVL